MPNQTAGGGLNDYLLEAMLCGVVCCRLEPMVYDILHENELHENEDDRPHENEDETTGGRDCRRRDCMRMKIIDHTRVMIV